MNTYDLLKNKYKRYQYIFCIAIIVCILSFIGMYQLRLKNSHISTLDILLSLLFISCLIVVFLFRTKLKTLKKDIRDIEIVKASIESTKSNHK